MASLRESTQLVCGLPLSCCLLFFPALLIFIFPPQSSLLSHGVPNIRPTQFCQFCFLNIIFQSNFEGVFSRKRNVLFHPTIPFFLRSLDAHSSLIYQMTFISLFPLALSLFFLILCPFHGGGLGKNPKTKQPNLFPFTQLPFPSSTLFPSFL